MRRANLHLLYAGAKSPAPAIPLAPRQGSFDDLGTPLSAVTFVVVDLETTGTAPDSCAITEIGAAKYRGGELIGTFQTLINPGVALPPIITLLTGITESMLGPAPPIAEVLPSFLEFVGGAVIVGHNIGFDLRFLNAALQGHEYEALSNRSVDTLALARRLWREEVPNFKLSTLAHFVSAAVQPTHRAFDDARATAEVFHALLERAGSLGVLGLDDLLALPTIQRHPSAGKLALTGSLPREPGVYAFRDGDGNILYVGKATNLRSRVRSYFSSDDRRKIPQLLRATARIEHRVCRNAFEAEVRELRLIRKFRPRFNQVGRRSPQPAAFLVLVTKAGYSRLSVVRAKPGSGSKALGPLQSSRVATQLKHALESSVGARSGEADHDFAEIVGKAIGGDPHPLMDRLTRRMHACSDAERYEDAAAARDDIELIRRTFERLRHIKMLRDAGRVVLEGPDGPVILVAGQLQIEGEQLELPTPRSSDTASSDDAFTTDFDDEILVVSRWLHASAERNEIRVVHVHGTLASPLPLGG